MGIEKLQDYRVSIKYDGSLQISTGRSRHEKPGRIKMYWSQLLVKLQEPTRTPETYKEYVKLSKAEQDQIKDIGGFVGGTLKEGRRKAENVSGRQMLTLDMDTAPVGFLDDVALGIVPHGLCMGDLYYHKHCPEKPRLRLLIPLDREVTRMNMKQLPGRLQTA